MNKASSKKRNNSMANSKIDSGMDYKLNSSMSQDELECSKNGADASLARGKKKRKADASKLSISYADEIDADVETVDRDMSLGINKMISNRTSTRMKTLEMFSKSLINVCLKRVSEVYEEEQTTRAKWIDEYNHSFNELKDRAEKEFNVMKQQNDKMAQALQAQIKYREKMLNTTSSIFELYKKQKEISTEAIEKLENKHKKQKTVFEQQLCVTLEDMTKAFCKETAKREMAEYKKNLEKCLFL